MSLAEALTAMLVGARVCDTPDARSAARVSTCTVTSKNEADEMESDRATGSRLLTSCPLTALKLAGKSFVVQIESTVYVMTYLDVK